jgi:hypothetical protein
MDVPLLPDPARPQAEPAHPLEPPPIIPLLAVIEGGSEATADRGQLRAVPEPGDDDRPASP